MFDLKTGRPGRDSRRVLADRHQRAGHPDLRSLSAAGAADGPLRDHSLGGRRDRPARRLSVHDRLARQGPGRARRPAEPRLGRREAARARSIPPCRRSSASPSRRRRSAGPIRASRAFSARRSARSSPTAKAGQNMMLERPLARSAAGSPQAARQPRPACAAKSTPAARCRRWIASPPAHSTCSPPAGWPMPSTCRRKTRRSATATATASPTTISTTARRRCNEHLLLARRLVEAGVRVVTLSLRPLGQPRQELRSRPRSRRQARPVPDAP